MLKYFESRETGLIVVSLGNGDLLLESIREVAKRADVHTGVLLSGLGSLSKGHYHTVVTNEMPPKNLFVELPGPLEIVSFGGVIAGYEPHVHICLMDASGKLYGGHLEDGCAILTLAEFAIRRVPDLKLTRRARDGSLSKLLDAE